MLPALSIARETGIGYVGPWLFALAAYTSDDASERERYLVEGEALLAGDVMFYNHFFYRRWAIELGLRDRDFARVTHHAAALLDAAAGQSLRLYRWVAERGLIWAAHGRGERSAELAARIASLASTQQLFAAGFELPPLEPGGR